MLKKCLFVIAVTALLAVTVQAGTPKIDSWEDSGDWYAYKGHPYPWPVEWQKVELCRIPVWMEIGFWVEIKDCDDAEILMEQVTCDEAGEDADMWPCYKGCTDIRVRTNFDAEMDGSFSDEDFFEDRYADDEAYFNGDDDLPIPGDGNWHEIEVCLVLAKVELWDLAAGAGEKAEIGYLKVRIKPETDWEDGPPW